MTESPLNSDQSLIESKVARFSVATSFTVACAVFIFVFLALLILLGGSTLHATRIIGLLAYLIAIPAILLLALAASSVSYQSLRWRRHIGKHLLCSQCGYILNANTTGICPECGVPISPDRNAL